MRRTNASKRAWAPSFSSTPARHVEFIRLIQHYCLRKWRYHLHVNIYLLTYESLSMPCYLWQCSQSACFLITSCLSLCFVVHIYIYTKLVYYYNILLLITYKNNIYWPYLTITTIYHYLLPSKMFLASYYYFWLPIPIPRISYYCNNNICYYATSYASSTSS